MTTSTAKKKKGPIRTEALLSIAIILAVGFVFMRFFFDKSLEKGLEWTGTQLHGAEVDIGSIKTSFLNAKFEINNIEVTDKKNPEFNLFQLKSARFSLLWDALLRAKVVINEASIEGIELKGKRSSAGYVVPPKVSANQPLQQMGKKITSHTKEEFDGNVLGDLASIAEGAKAKNQVGEIRETLSAEKKIAELEAALDEKQKEWESNFARLKQADDLKEIQKKIKAVKVDKKKPWKALKQYKNLGKEVKNKINEYKVMSKNLKTDLNMFKNGFKEVELLTKKDLISLQNRFNLPSLNPKDFAAKLFGKMIQEKMGESFKYVEMAREYLPKKGREKKPKLTPPKRGAGRTYSFPVTTGYPLFWWKKGLLSSQSKQGTFEAEVFNITSDPVYLKKPATMKFKGDFPALNLRSLSGRGTFDHTTAVAKDDVTVKVGSYPMNGQKLVSSEKLTFGFKKASGNYVMNTKMIDSNVTFFLKGKFSKIDYLVESPQKMVKNIFTRAAKKTPLIDVQARANGPWDKLSWRITSNLGNALSQGVKGEVQAEIDNQKRALKKKLDDKIGPKMAKLESKYAGIKNKFDNLLGKKEKQVKSIGDQALNGAKNSAKKESPKAKAEKKLKKLFKKIKF